MKIHISGDKAHLWGDWTTTEMRYNAIDSLTGLLDRIQSSGKKKLLIDCAHLENIDFSGIHFLNIWLQCLNLRGIDHEFVNMSEPHEKSLRAIGNIQGVPLNTFVQRYLPSTMNKRREGMTFDEIKTIAKQNNIKTGKATKRELVRAIQNAEGNSPCFGSNISKECGQENCLWRGDCA